MPKQLNPCPECREDAARLMREKSKKGFKVFCFCCGFGSKLCNTPDEAAEDWNRKKEE